jgi:hypothetical protein
MCIKCIYECDKNQMPYCNQKISKNQNFGNFGPLIDYGPCWINFTIITFISEKKEKKEI